MKKPEPTMFPITSAVQDARPRLGPLAPPDPSPLASLMGPPCPWSLIRKGDGFEEAQHRNGGLAEVRRVDRGDVPRTIELAQRGIDEQAQVLVVARECNRGRLVGEVAVEHDQIS